MVIIDCNKCCCAIERLLGINKWCYHSNIITSTNKLHAGDGLFPTFLCEDGSMNFNIEVLCDGYADCRDASDESNGLCESKLA